MVSPRFLLIDWGLKLEKVNGHTAIDLEQPSPPNCHVMLSLEYGTHMQMLLALRKKHSLMVLKRE